MILAGSTTVHFGNIGQPYRLIRYFENQEDKDSGMQPMNMILVCVDGRWSNGSMGLLNLREKP